MTPNTDIVISSRITREFPAEGDLQLCVDTLIQHTKNYRVIFVDDNSDEQGARFIEAQAARLSNSLLLRTHFQRWFTRAYNLGFQLVRTPYVVSLNCDTVLDKDWLEELYSVRDDVEAKIGRVGLVGSHQSGEEPRRYALSIDKDYVTGHGVLFNVKALQEVANYRNTPGIYLDELRADAIHIRSDVFICWDMNRLGWQTVKSFKAAIGHSGAKTWGQQLWRIPNSVSVVNERWE